MAEKKTKKNVFIGVAWPYVNGDLHIGHLAGYLLPADIFARFNRLCGKKTLMVSGSDCYGTPISMEAEKNGVKPEEIVKKYAQKQKELFKLAEISFDLFTKTATPNHNKVVQDFFVALAKNGYLSIKTTKQFYSETDKRFLPDRYVEGECSLCGYDSARSDQCDKCGRVLEPEQLKNPRSKITKSVLNLKDTEHYFIEWSKLEKFLNSYFKKNSNKWRPWVKNETADWLKKGILPRAITRDLDWGIKIPISRLPKNLQIKDSEHKRIYVWFDAVIGYLSASIEWGLKNHKSYKDFWYKDTEQYYFMGKDNLVFHTIFWPGQLYAYDKKINLPNVLAVNQFLTLDGQKFSKSRGITISSEEIIKKFGSDLVRFYLCSIMPENSDASFTWEDFKNRINGALIGNYGNFVNRILNLSKELDLKSKFIVSPEIIKKSEKAYADAQKALSETRFKDYVNIFLSLADFGNKYLTEKKPWETKKTNLKSYRQTMIDSLYLALALNVIMKPLMPTASKNFEKQINIKVEKWPETKGFNKEILSQLKKFRVPKQAKPLFIKIEEIGS